LTKNLDESLFTENVFKGHSKFHIIFILKTSNELNSFKKKETHYTYDVLHRTPHSVAQVRMT